MDNNRQMSLLDTRTSNGSPEIENNTIMDNIRQMSLLDMRWAAKHSASRNRQSGLRQVRVECRHVH
eukprot:3362676-Lingulodinium_polyedra.AAC.1